MRTFDIFECSGQNLSNSLCQFWNNKSISLQILYPSSFLWKITPLYFFSSKKINILLKRSLLKWKFLRLSGAQVKMCQISYVNFETASRFLSKFASLFSFMTDNSYVLFSLKQYIHFAQRETIKVKLFETFDCSGQNLSNSLCQFWNDKSIPF